ncbi:unnamed protein product [Microthlaspi erraticum]|uniref:Uncharacterized protein n=1 Tax=Microthlaspi erraticum TaxID=1685480 RepID=A0A6D2KDN1_9BRAS|nr:unnamed protein product [Microthlaspi erraticum]
MRWDRERSIQTVRLNLRFGLSFGAFWSIWDERSMEDLAHGRSSTGYAKEEGGSHLEDQLDQPRPQLDRPSFNSIELRSQQSNPKNVASPLTFL